MRRELVLVFVAISTTIVIAFVVPLGLSARSTARDRALDRARAEAANLIPFLATGDLRSVTTEVEQVNQTSPLAVTVVMADGTETGSPVADRERLQFALDQRTSISGPTDGGHELITAVALPGEQAAAIRVFVPSSELNHGVLPALATLVALGTALVLIAVALADRIAQRVIKPAERLAEAATVLGDGQFNVRVEPAGPPELETTARAFNTLVGRVEKMLADEREMVSELTHRLRTPLTRLRVGLDQIDDAATADKLHQDVNALTAEVNDLIVRARHNVDPPTRVDLADVVASRFDYWSALASDEERPCSLRREATVELAAARDEIEAALDVMIDNVFAHTPPGTGFALSLTAEARGGCTLAIDDAGSGFGADLIGAGASGSGSTGLGLAIVERLTAKAGGTLTLTDSEMGGARVECWFPPSG